MIKIDDRYVITADPYSYTLNYLIKPEDANEEILRRFGKGRAKKDRLKPLGYFCSISDALKYYVDHCSRKSVEKEEVNSIEEYIQLIEKLYIKIGEVINERN